jgi:YD repeat-containing protein
MDVRRRTLAIVRIACAVLASLMAVAPASASFEVTHFGDFYFEITDIHAPGALGMEISRVYNSFDTARKGIFGIGWGSRAEDYLKVQDDGSIVVHEYGGGANNKFKPTTSSLRPQNVILDEIMRGAEKTGLFGSEADRQAYRKWLESSEENEEQAWEELISLGLLKSHDPAVGETFFSGRFATEFVTRVAEGYQRETTYNSRTIFEAFDLSGRLTRFWDANHDYVALDYGPGGHLRETTDNEGHRFAFSFTSSGFVSRIEDSRGHVVRYQYKNSDLQSVDANGIVTRYDYDPDNRLVAIRYHDRTSMQMAYDQDGMATRVKDTDGTVATYAYATHTTKTSRVDSVDTMTRKQSGESHHKMSQYFYEYDAPNYYLDRATETDDGVVATDATYDRNLNPLTITTPKGTTSSAYDSLGRLVRKQMPTGTVYNWEYDPATGKVSIATTTDKDSVLTEHFQYDPKGNLARAYDSDGHDFSITYDPYGRIAAVAGSTVQLSFEYTDGEVLRPATVVLGGTGSVRIAYLADGTVGNAQSSDGTVVVDKVGATLKIVDDLIRAAGADVITLPAPKT